MTPSATKTEMTKEFIIQVKKNRCLYDLNDKKKFSYQEIENIWQKIANQCNLTNISQAKRKWQYLASQYKKGLNGQKKSSFHTQLSFLYSFVQNIEDVDDDEVEFIMKQECVDNQPERPTSSASGRNASNCRFRENRPSTSSGRHSALSDYRFCQGSAYGPSEPMHVDNINDDLKPLFEAWYRATKKLPLTLQLHVKSQFSQIINAAEMAAATEIAASEAPNVQQFNGN